MKTMSELPTATFANLGISRKNPEVQTSSASAEDSNSKRALDRRLDEALKDTFPASDAVSIVISVRNG
jgi:hypothetical protein